MIINNNIERVVERNTWCNRSWALLSLVMLVVLASCGTRVSPEIGEGEQISSVDVAPEDQSSLEASYEGALAVEEQLMLGILALDGTELAIEPGQASDLSLLWKTYRNLLDEDNVTDLEFAGLLVQIEGTLTSEQVAAIADMQLTNEDRSNIMQQFASQLEFSFEEGESRGGSEGAEGAQNFGFPGAGPPEGFTGGPGGGRGQLPEGIDPQQLATLQAERQASGESLPRRVQFMLGALIEYLDEIVG